MSDDQKPINAPAVADDEEAVFETDDGRSAKAPFQKGVEIDLNGRVFKCAKLTRKDVILEIVRETPSRGRIKPIQLNDQFEFKGWLFKIVKITPAQYKRKTNGRQKWTPYTLAVRPVAIRKETAAQHLIPAGSGEAPTGFVIERTDGGPSPIPGIADVEEFARLIIERLECPEVADEYRIEWAAGVQGFFEGKKEADCPWDTSVIIKLGEAEAVRQERIAKGTFWLNGWNQAFKASLIVYRDMTTKAGGTIEDADLRLAADAEAAAEETAQAAKDAQEAPPPLVFRPRARELFEQARAIAEGRAHASPVAVADEASAQPGDPAPSVQGARDEAAPLQQDSPLEGAESARAGRRPSRGLSASDNEEGSAALSGFCSCGCGCRMKAKPGEWCGHCLGGIHIPDPPEDLPLDEGGEG